MTFQEEDEMTDEEIRLRFGSLIDEAAKAFSIDANYSADIVRRAKTVLARRAKRQT